MSFRKIPHPKVAEAVVAEFETLMLHGVLRPGDRLPPERELAETLGVSRTSLRHAMDGLARRGLIERRQGSGAVVSELLASSLVDPLGALIGGRSETLSDYIAFRRLIESDAAARAARLAAPADRAQIEEILERMREAHDHGPPTREATLDVDLHMAIVEAAGNAVTTQVMRALGRSLSQAMAALRAKIYAAAGFRDEILAQHEAIAAAILAGDAAAARAASDAHLDYVAQELAAAEDAARRADLAERRLGRRD